MKQEKGKSLPTKRTTTQWQDDAVISPPNPQNLFEPPSKNCTAKNFFLRSISSQCRPLLWIVTIAASTVLFRSSNQSHLHRLMASSIAPRGDPVSLTLQEALSGIFGSISLAAWVFLLVPQLVQNYTQQSAAGISLLFLTVWLVGDLTNLIGAAWAQLVPTVVALAVYFCIADTILISQCLYYNFLNRRKSTPIPEDRLSNGTEQRPNREDEHAPLLRRASHSSIGLPGSHTRRRSSAASRRLSRGTRRDSLAEILEEESGSSGWIKNLLSLLAVCLIGTAGWAIAWRTGVWQPAPTGGAGSGEGPERVAWGAQVLGYASAVCYLGARLPQIYKNWQEKSCEGLSLLFFLLSLLGNATYGAGILFHSLEKEYLIKNLPWLIGSLGTMAEDAAIFIQFRIYQERSTGSALVAG
ncbi:PQ-loop-domain-containing protein [Trichodelitschia bisporula]|uniref:PQ-loop-domain-containing protein n=1 Tax=Trichodelitschia bisporula TaxID=703511 RepID=A0A6G1HTI8_9PEZI|nr:PQ-loop-domain-containing protein [Trichodelitschia bisporula]